MIYEFIKREDKVRDKFKYGKKNPFKKLFYNSVN